MLIVNVASECGYTDSHYTALQQLYQLLQPTGRFTIIGISYATIVMIFWKFCVKNRINFRLGPTFYRKRLGNTNHTLYIPDQL